MLRQALWCREKLGKREAGWLERRKEAWPWVKVVDPQVAQRKPTERFYLSR